MSLNRPTTPLEKAHKRGICSIAFALKGEGHCLSVDSHGVNPFKLPVGSEFKETWICSYCGPVFTEFHKIKSIHTSPRGYPVATYE